MRRVTEVKSGDDRQREKGFRSEFFRNPSRLNRNTLACLLHSGPDLSPNDDDYEDEEDAYNAQEDAYIIMHIL